MRTQGSIFTVVALGVGVAMTAAILDVNVSGDATGEAVLSLLSPFGTLLGLVFFMAAMGLLMGYFTDSGM